MYLVSLGGFDTHANQVVDGNKSQGTHATLLKNLSEAVLAFQRDLEMMSLDPVSYTHLRAHETVLDLVCRLLLEKKKQKEINNMTRNSQKTIDEIHNKTQEKV